MRGGPLVPAISISSSSSIVGCINTLRRQHCSPPLGFHTSKYWDKFYKRHQNKFFKDRHYLVKDWGQYFYGDNTVSPYGKVILEVGCGAGNTIFPLIATCPKLFVHACDFSSHAIALVKAFCPKKMPLILKNIKKVLKPNGYILLRDYAIGDYAQVELRKRNQMISENFYIRGDGTHCRYGYIQQTNSESFSEHNYVSGTCRRGPLFIHITVSSSSVSICFIHKLCSYLIYFVNEQHVIHKLC
ncbi:methyltransferase-like protein 6 isoform X6 [Camellia sinensis]|uniref:methyltransferase-like protein 6 isoform X6 n=1 Tax=Camellia sinensis TaxID=4442 RepID=UPI001036835E|nr:methyltransferase-like protein 6 isoform X6 [Camellia sinensis]